MENSDKRLRTYSEESLKNLSDKLSEAKGTKVKFIDHDISVSFTSLNKAGQYILDNGLDHVNIKNVVKKIQKAINNNKELYGYKWEYIDMKCNDYPGRE